MTQLFVIPMTMVVVAARLTLGMVFLGVALPFMVAVLLLHVCKVSARGVQTGRTIVDVPIVGPVKSSETLR